MTKWNWLTPTFISFVIICTALVIWGLLKQNIIATIISVAIFGGVALILGFFQVVKLSPMTPKQRSISLSLIAIATLLGVAIVGLGLFTNGNTGDQFSNSSTLHPPATSILASPNLTPSLTTMAKAIGLETPLPITLDCSCSVPVLVTITQIMIQPQLNRMLWSLTLYNNSQNSAYTFFKSFSLQEGDKLHNPTGPRGQTYNPTGPLLSNDGQSLQAGETRRVTLTFSFVPHTDRPYTLGSLIAVINYSSVLFAPVLVQFK